MREPLRPFGQRAPLRRGLTVSLAVILLLAALVTVYVLRIGTGLADFAVNHLAGQRLAAGETLYRTADGHFMFKYLPPAALLYVPLGALPLPIAGAVWFAMSLAALAGMFVLTNRLVPRAQARYVLLVSGLILAKYFLHELRLGQINVFVTVVLLASLGALSSSTGASPKLRAGTLAGVAIALKPYAALIVPYLIVARRWRSLVACVATLLVLLAVPTVFYGIQGNVELLRQWAVTLSVSTPTLLTNNDNVSIVAFFTKWLGDPQRALLPAGVVLGVLALLTLAVIARGRSEPRAAVLEGALVLTLIPLVSPLGWDYTFLMALLAVVLIVNHFGAFPRPARWLLAVNFALIALTVYDVMGREAYSRYMQWSVTTLNFIVVVAALAYLRFRQVC